MKASCGKKSKFDHCKGNVPSISSREEQEKLLPICTGLRFFEDSLLPFLHAGGSRSAYVLRGRNQPCSSLPSLHWGWKLLRSLEICNLLQAAGVVFLQTTSEKGREGFVEGVLLATLHLNSTKSCRTLQVLPAQRAVEVKPTLLQGYAGLRAAVGTSPALQPHSSKGALFPPPQIPNPIAPTNHRTPFSSGGPMQDRGPWPPYKAWKTQQGCVNGRGQDGVKEREAPAYGTSTSAGIPVSGVATKRAERR